MMFTGNLIEDLIATVERIETAHADAVAVSDPLVSEAWFASAQENADFESELRGVA